MRRRYIACVLFLVFICGASASAQNQFLSSPFYDSSVELQNAPIYFDDTPHGGAGFAFDYAKGQLLESATWETFEVRAAAGGVAIQSEQSGYGSFVLIKHDEVDSLGRAYYTLYAHLDSVSARIPTRAKDDQNFALWGRMRDGDFLGMAGDTGKVCARPCIHLHFEVFRGEYFENAIDPYDISSELNKFAREAYVPVAFPGCGASILWKECPPRLADGELIVTRDTILTIEFTVGPSSGPADTLTLGFWDGGSGPSAAPFAFASLYDGETLLGTSERIPFCTGSFHWATAASLVGTTACSTVPRIDFSRIFDGSIVGRIVYRPDAGTTQRINPGAAIGEPFSIALYRHVSMGGSSGTSHPPDPVITRVTVSPAPVP